MYLEATSHRESSLDAQPRYCEGHMSESIDRCTALYCTRSQMSFRMPAVFSLRASEGKLKQWAEVSRRSVKTMSASSM